MAWHSFSFRRIRRKLAVDEVILASSNVLWIAGQGTRFAVWYNSPAFALIVDLQVNPLHKTWHRSPP